jgi:hypothetical protein
VKHRLHFLAEHDQGQQRHGLAESKKKFKLNDCFLLRFSCLASSSNRRLGKVSKKSVKKLSQ